MMKMKRNKKTRILVGHPVHIGRQCAKHVGYEYGCTYVHIYSCGFTLGDSDLASTLMTGLNMLLL